MDIKMIVTDLDGTLLNSNDEVLKSSIEIFKKIKLKGILPVVATGRIYSESKDFIKKIDATEYFIGMNGSKIEDLKQNKIIFEKVLQKNYVEEISLFLEESNIFYQVYSDNDVLCKANSFKNIDESGISKSYLNQYKKTIKVISSLDNYKVYKIFIVEKNFSKIKKLICFLDNNFKELRIVKSLNNYYEIIHKSINKGEAILKLCQYIRISTDNVLSIGDSQNDIEMLKISKIGVCLENADDDVKKIADFVSKSNDDNGISYAINNFIEF